MTKKIFLLLFLLLSGVRFSSFVWANSSLMHSPSDSVLLFVYFKNNGQDGIHMAYSQDGYHWSALNADNALLKPEVGTEKLMRDPCIIQGSDGIFRMVWTCGWKDKGVGYAFSRDLVHWSAQQYLPLMSEASGAKNCWAPEVFYDSRSHQYMIFWATTIDGKFMKSYFNGQNDNNHRLYYVLTPDFLHFSKVRLLYDQGFNVIDATLKKTAGRYVMFLKDETKVPKPEKNIRVAFSKSLSKGYGKPSAPITGNYWAEGPTVAYLNGTWIVYFDKYTSGRYGAVSSKDLKTWTDISSELSMPKGIRHGTVFMVSRSDFERSGLH